MCVEGDAINQYKQHIQLPLHKKKLEQRKRKIN